MTSFVLLATAWGSRHGGINSFNRDFAGGLASALGDQGRVFCAVLDADDLDKKDAQQLNVSLISLNEKKADLEVNPNFVAQFYQILTTDYNLRRVDWWVGHDVSSGEAALIARRFGGQAALIMHMSYIDYQGYKHDDAVYANAKSRQQKRIFSDKEAALFSVGPTLREACFSLARRAATMLVPGFPNLPKSYPPQDKMAAITFGRLDLCSDRIKQGRLAVAGFAKAVMIADHAKAPKQLINNPRFAFVGLSDDGSEHEKICALAEKGRKHTTVAF